MLLQNVLPFWKEEGEKKKKTIVSALEARAPLTLTTWLPTAMVGRKRRQFSFSFFFKGVWKRRYVCMYEVSLRSLADVAFWVTNA